MREGDKTIDESRQGEALLVDAPTSSKKLYLESYGCAMNFSDSEIIASILSEVGYSTTKDEKEADLILVNTCSIREKAEDRVRNRLNEFKQYKRKNRKLVVGMLGCMAERLKESLLEQEKLVDLVVGPDAYRDLPNLIELDISNVYTIYVVDINGLLTHGERHLFLRLWKRLPS